ncbi:multicopper oxidase like protein [Thermothielavioides terrestris NRRL 8126]|uniref:Multicopper oxidase like protein n=1 Tax=Thermothielavioides terrestris (strain ATCC 38088 / NRRL 8126) TaxID=578455 RepID=G2QX58_THETT|nr:multicopper oxidase like protein [Thermothielavioides terrestris NRRL 8126]AEO62279.1 multicopper oxidase like protein [Thermothielavioides terrestris NRRL 8126]
MFWSRCLELFLSLPALVIVVRAGTVTYDWNVTWVWAKPDGFGRPVIGINHKWPCPTLEATVGDTVIVNFLNKLGNQTAGLHFHGVSQLQTPEMDGPSGVTQCPVPPDASVKYQFTADAPGTFWYHSHNMGQYPDGLRGPLIVHDPNDPYKSSYDEEVILSVSDCLKAVQSMLSPYNTRFAPPIPDSLIVNEGLGSHINVTKGKTYRIRIINFAAFGSAMIHFDSHTMNIIANDAAYVKKTDAYQLRIAPAQRYDVLIAPLDQDSGNYPFLISLDLNRDWTNSSQQLKWAHNYTGYLVLDSSKKLDKKDVVNKWQPIDESLLEPYDGAAAYSSYDQLIQLDFKFCLDQNGYPRSCFNNITYISQKVPTLYSVATTGDQNTNPVIYGQVNPFIVNFNQTVQIVVNNIDTATHPFHLHGHHFQLLARPSSGVGTWPGHEGNYVSTPPMRDTVTVMPNSYAVLRFRADNPGVWLFHCHIEWHVEMGLTATIIEAPDRLRNLTFPDDHIDVCKKSNTPYQGNAAGNTKNVTDTSGFVTVPPTTYSGCVLILSSLPTPFPFPPRASP